MKLVRDRIPDIIRQNGEEPNVRIADDTEYWLALRAKLQEEVGEFLESEHPDEIADIREVLDAICRHKEFSDIQERQDRKREERGGFDDRLILK
jgi:predicted house-cleaning noncanonical NTP pyrophosphatase (MazG superfamily)